MERRRIFMRFPEERAKTLTFSYDDGVEGDVRLVKLLNRYGMKGTFNVNSGLYGTPRRMSRQQVDELFADGVHEVAVHSLTHPFLEVLPSAAVAYEVMEDRKNLERQFGRIVRGMAYPMGTFCDETVSVLRTCGIAYARTVVSTERFDLPTDWLRLPATCHHANPRLMELAKKFAEKEVVAHPKMFYLWGHTYEFDDSDNWNIIEEFTEYLGGREEEIWYATNMEIYEYVQAWERLVWSTDMGRVYNPTDKTLYFVSREKPYSVAPGETLNLEDFE